MAKLIYAATPRSADMLYATGFQAPDPFIFLENKGVKTIVLSDLEIDRGRREARVDQILSFSELSQEIGGHPPLGVVVAYLLGRNRISGVEVPSDFPLGLARVLEKAGLRVKPVPGHFWPERECKTKEEIASIRRALRITQAGLRRAVEVLRASRPGPGNRLVWSGRRLTSEILRAEADAAVLRAGGIPREDARTIGCARRLATYKRATLIFRDRKRLSAILNDPQRPVQIVFAGKAHPRDTDHG